MTFPIFDICLSETENKTENIPIDNLFHLSELIENLDLNGTEIILAIIRKYQLEIDKGNICDLPYDCKQNKNGYKFTITKLPLRLIYMIQHFVNLHIQKVSEEKELLQQQNQLP